MVPAPAARSARLRGWGSSASTAVGARRAAEVSVTYASRSQSFSSMRDRAASTTSTSAAGGVSSISRTGVMPVDTRVAVVEHLPEVVRELVDGVLIEGGGDDEPQLDGVVIRRGRRDEFGALHDSPFIRTTGATPPPSLIFGPGGRRSTSAPRAAVLARLEPIAQGPR